MQRFLYVLAAVVALAILIGLISRANARKESETAAVARLGTGSIAGLYYPLGGAIAAFVGEKKDAYHFWVAPQPTNGSAENIRRVLAGELELGIAQADALHAAYTGDGDWYSTGPQKELRALASLHVEPVVLVMHESARYAALADLRGKHVNLGPAGSGVRPIALTLLRSAGLEPSTDVRGEAWDYEEVAKRYVKGEIDGFFYAGAIPNETIVAAMARKGTHVAPTTLAADPQQYPFFITTSVDATAAGTAAVQRISTLGVRAVLFTRLPFDSRQVFGITSQLFQRVDDLTKMHPGFAGLTKEDMVEGVPIPFHEGATRYFDQAGIEFKRVTP